MMVDVSRAQKELTECNHGRQVSGVSIELHNGANISHLIGTITAPANSPYEGGTFTIDIRLPGEPPVPLQSLPPHLEPFIPSDPLSIRLPRRRARGIADFASPS
jgi:ubiquitin-conjugating enzyme (huntingtin interacting protein 2)